MFLMPATLRVKSLMKMVKHLPFATVYIHNTTYGVTTNSIGNYFIELKPGYYSITYSFIGYQSIIHNVSLTNEPLTIDVILSAQTTQLVEFEVYSNTKNKAKEVMSNVRKNRKKHLDAVSSYCLQHLHEKFFD